MEFFGLLGGIFSLYMKIIRYIGQIMLKILYNIKNKEKKELLEKLKIKEIEI